MGDPFSFLFLVNMMPKVPLCLEVLGRSKAAQVEVVLVKGNAVVLRGRWADVGLPTSFSSS